MKEDIGRISYQHKIPHQPVAIGAGAEPPEFPHAPVPLPVATLVAGGWPHPRATFVFGWGGGPQPDAPLAIDVSPPPLNPRPAGVPQPDPLCLSLFIPDVLEF